MSSTGLLILSNPIKIGWLLQLIQNQVRKSLYIQVLPGWNIDCSTANELCSSSKYIAQLSHLVSGLYTQASAICHHLDVRVLLSQRRNPAPSENSRQIDVMFVEQTAPIETYNFTSNCFGIEKGNSKVVNLEEGGEVINNELSKIVMQNVKDCQPKETDIQYTHVVLGGTFDRLHNGHKELLSQAIIRCKTKLTVGVTDASMVHSKVLHELIEPCEVRIEKVKKFLEDVDKSLEYNVVPISDPFGPTKDDPTMDMIVVSAETLRGGEKVNELRTSRGLDPLKIHCVSLLEELLPANLRDIEAEDWKISSSSQRVRLLGTSLRQPQIRSDLPSKPYVIGLTGGIASGKSKIGDRLEALGAGVINCDLVGHEVYEPGTKGHQLVIQEFGQGVLGQDGKIDRRALGQIVFGNESQLAKLNSLLWPLMSEMVEQRLAVFKEEGKKVAVVEAAVLTRAGWHQRCHEIWAVIVPPNEAIRRLQERNGLSEEECKKRLEAQPSNVEHVNIANIVFSPSWSPEHTSQQVQRAWNQLQTRLQASPHL